MEGKVGGGDEVTNAGERILFVKRIRLSYTHWNNVQIINLMFPKKLEKKITKAFLSLLCCRPLLWTCNRINKKQERTKSGCLKQVVVVEGNPSSTLTLLQASVLSGCNILDEHANNIWLDLGGWLLQVLNLLFSFLCKSIGCEARVPSSLQGEQKKL